MNPILISHSSNITTWVTELVQQAEQQNASKRESRPEISQKTLLCRRRKVGLGRHDGGGHRHGNSPSSATPSNGITGHLRGPAILLGSTDITQIYTEMVLCKARRPFIWQDEMAEVKNLFRKVAKVKRSGYSGFSLWKDEPTAETLSRNRLRRRRSQFALELTHLNYGESPFEALTHLHNIRGMCARIQRQDRATEKKKKVCNLELQPALLRRPATVPATSWSTSGTSLLLQDHERAACSRPRPGSAPVMAGTPLHYAPPRPTVLYDATHRCPRYKELPRRPSRPHSGGGIRSGAGPRAGTCALRAMANDHHHQQQEQLWDSTTPSRASPGSSTRYSTTTSVPSSTRTSGAINGGNSSLRASAADCSSLSGGVGSPLERAKGSEKVQSLYSRREVESTVSEATTVETHSPASAFCSEMESADETPASPASSSGGKPAMAASMAPAERPPSRMMSKRPSSDATSNKAEKWSGSGSLLRRDVQTPPSYGELASAEAIGRDSVLDSGPNAGAAMQDGLTSATQSSSSSSSRPPSRKGGEGGPRISQDQTGNSTPITATLARLKAKYGSLPGDGSSGLWALRQEDQRPTTAGATMPQGQAAALSAMASHARPSTSPAVRRVEDSFPRQESSTQRVRRFGSSPSMNKAVGKKALLQAQTAQRVVDEGLQEDVLSRNQNPNPVHDPTRNAEHQSYKADLKPTTTASVAPRQNQSHELNQRWQSQAHEFSSEGEYNFEQPTSPTHAKGQASALTEAAATSVDESHVMIKHSTDPYADFRTSMLRMIHEEDLYHKHWELEELFQYYMDLNPAVHHEVLKTVISDIRIELAGGKVAPGREDGIPFG